MKITQEKTVTKCDFCGATDNVWSSCDNCRKDICYECRNTKAHEYPHGIYCSGSGDALYCNECDSKLMAQGDARQAKYILIERLRNEGKAWGEDYRRRCDAAEAAVKS